MKFLGLVFLVFGVLIGFAPTAYWIMHPELSQMQITLKFWLAIFAAPFLIIPGFILLTRSKS